jgi:uncharacterized protein (TIGR03437 family)
LPLLLALALPAVCVAQLTTTGNQYWQQGFEGLPDVPENNDNLGFAVAVADFDGDGLMDAAVGAPGEDTGKGLVHVLFGAVDGLTALDSQVWKPGSDAFPGNWEDGDASGSALAAGDFNGDGYADLAIGTPGEDKRQGAINVLYGSLGGGLTLNGVGGFNQGPLEGDGNQDGDQFGGSLASGDFNNDGYYDLVVGSPGEENSGVLIHVLYGSSVGLRTDGNQRWRQGRDNIPGSRENGDSFGFAVATGDFNNDSFDDIAIGAPGEDSGKGSLHVLLGSGGGIGSGGNQRWFQGKDGLPDDDENNDVFGISLTTGDFNGDGFDDLAIGVPGEDNGRGIAHVVYGTTAGLAAAGNQIFAQGFEGMQGDSRNGDAFGLVLAAGDFGGDFAADLVVGVPNEDGGGSWGVFQTLLGNQQPTINAVVSAGLGLPAISTLSPNTLATAFGAGLYESASGRGVGPADLVNGALPTLLDRTCLEIDGQRSPLVFLRNDQVNFQVSSSVTGQMQIKLIRNCGEFYELPGNTISVPVAAVSPDMFAYQVLEDGTKSVAAINAVTGMRIGPTALGPEFAPAKPDDTVAIFVTGLGLTNPPFDAGQLPPNDASGARPAPPVRVFIDGVEVVVQYAGTAPGFAGLYQINFVIPLTPNIGEVTITIISSGGGPVATTPSNGFIAVQWDNHLRKQGQSH